MSSLEDIGNLLVDLVLPLEKRIVLFEPLLNDLKLLLQIFFILHYNLKLLVSLVVLSCLLLKLSYSVGKLSISKFEVIVSLFLDLKTFVRSLEI